MIKNTNEYEETISKILLAVINGINITDYETIIPGIGTDDYNEILFDCIESKYIARFDTWRDGYHKVHIIPKGKTRITREGLQFIDYVNNKKYSDIANSANKKSDVAKIRANIAIIISLTGVFIQLLSNLHKIVSNLEWVISCLS
jgi:hypothetical protein